MAEFTKVANVEDIPQGSARAFNVNGIEVAVFNLAGDFLAISNTCGHVGGPLAEGEVVGVEVVVCPWHGWEWNLRSGQNVADPDSCLPCFACKVENGEVFVAAG